MTGRETRSERLRRLGMGSPITRRDFIDGIAVSAALAGSSRVVAAIDPDGAGIAPQDRPGYYPPTLTGMRGSHPGSFEVAHKLRDGTFRKTGARPIETGEDYDLIVVGGGISGLAAAYFYRAKAGADARILILDNHDDFGGHAKRNEFELDGKIQLINGGTLGIDSPRPYSTVAAGLLAALGIDPVALAARHADRGFYPSLGLGSGVFFDKETFGADRLVKGEISSPDFLEHAPLSEAAERDVRRLETEPIDYLPGLSPSEKKARLSRISYRDYLLDLVKVDPSVIALYQSRTHGEWGVGIDAVSALDVWPFGLPGFQGLTLDPGSARIWAIRRPVTPTVAPASSTSPTAMPASHGSWCAASIRKRYPAQARKTWQPRASTIRSSIGRITPSASGSAASPSPSAAANLPPYSTRSRWSIPEWIDFIPAVPGTACSPAGT